MRWLKDGFYFNCGIVVPRGYGVNNVVTWNGMIGNELEFENELKNSLELWLDELPSM